MEEDSEYKRELKTLGGIGEGSHHRTMEKGVEGGGVANAVAMSEVGQPRGGRW